jgi:pre-mRNA-splicing factor CWC26
VSSDSDSDLEVVRRTSDSNTATPSTTSNNNNNNNNAPPQSSSDSDMEVVRRPAAAPVQKVGLLSGAEFGRGQAAEHAIQAAQLAQMVSENGEAATVYRNAEGRIMTAEEVAEAQQQQQEEKSKTGRKDVPVPWASGLVQQQQDRADQDALDAVSTTVFKRSKDDAALNEAQRAELRAEDPMAAFATVKKVKKAKKPKKVKVKKKKKKKHKRKHDASSEDSSAGEDMVDLTAVAAVPAPAQQQSRPRPLYTGQPWPNRFKIKPGYRWDGVVRGNGWERKLFAQQNATSARSKAKYAFGARDM